ncbi:MAG: hypothetical protein AABZ47_17880 [Planctomycetota bacterium]
MLAPPIRRGMKSRAAARTVLTVIVFCFQTNLGSTCAIGQANPWADVVLDASSVFDRSSDYNDPDSLLSMPSTDFFDPLFRETHYASLVTGAFNRSPTGQKLLVTIGRIGREDFVKVRFSEPVEDHPRNPFGIDLIVHGNSFFSGSDFVSPDTNMEEYYLTGGVFSEPVTVAVSDTGIGNPRSHPQHWYEFVHGPFADSLFPTNPYRWQRDEDAWDVIENESYYQSTFTTPVDPRWTAEDFAGMSAADAMDLYLCSGGGTGFDLAYSGFSCIQFVYLTSTGGEVDALVDVFPSLGDFGNRDGVVDLIDFQSFQNCYGDDFLPRPGCMCRSADFDGDGNIREFDLLEFVRFLDGPLGIEFSCEKE